MSEEGQFSRHRSPLPWTHLASFSHFSYLRSSPRSFRLVALSLQAAHRVDLVGLLSSDFAAQLLVVHSFLRGARELLNASLRYVSANS
jgi:hypothetical protein